MNHIDDLTKRLDAVSAMEQQHAAQVRAEAEQTYEQRKAGYQQFLAAFEQVRAICVPRLELLAKRFQFDATPVHSEHERGLEMVLRTDLARVKLKFTASHDADVMNLFVDYYLEILPVFIKFSPHERYESPLASVDYEAFAKWFDDRLVEFAKTYAEMTMNDYYLKDHMVTDPVANVRFPKMYAHSQLERAGQVYYFLNEETRRKFEQSPGAMATA